MDAFNFKLLVDFPVSSAYSGCYDSHGLPFVCWTLLIVLIHFMSRYKCREEFRDFWRALNINFIRTPPIFIRTCTDEYGNPIP